LKHIGLWSVAASVGCLLLGSPAYGQILNGNFNGNLNNWSQIGYSAAVGADGAVVPISGSFQALIASGGGCAGDDAGAVPLGNNAKKALATVSSKHQLLARPGGQRLRPAFTCGSINVADATEAAMETFLNLPSGAINTALPNLFTTPGCSGPSCTATDGAAIFQQFTVTTAPTTLSFYWNMGTIEDLPTQWDGALYSFRVGANPAQVFALADTETSSFVPDSGSSTFDSTTGYHVVNIPISTNGTYSIGFLSMQTGDDEAASGTYISNVQLGAAQAPPVPSTPVPSSWYLVLIGMAFLAFYMGWQGRAASRA
jgi:hypothetical protein